MILYKFSTWLTKPNELFSVREIEVEEKAKTYIGKGCRVFKEDIGALLTNSGDEMILLENNPEIYINAMIERYKSRVDVAEIRLAQTRERLSKWSELKKRLAESEGE